VGGLGDGWIENAGRYCSGLEWVGDWEMAGWKLLVGSAVGYSGWGTGRWLDGNCW
jgi:hypothetical protein